MATVEEIKELFPVGSKVCVTGYGTASLYHNHETIERYTPTLMITDAHRFRMKPGGFANDHFDSIPYEPYSGYHVHKTCQRKKPATPIWTMPEWMNPYTEVMTKNADEITEIINRWRDKKKFAEMKESDPDGYAQATMIVSQVNLLYRLHEKGHLK